MRKIALALIVKGTEEEAKLLDRCLESVSPYVDGIFVTLTQPSEDVEKIVGKYKGILSRFEWCNDFSKARNYNFSQVTKDFDYIIWTDADDIWRGLDKLRPLLEEHPHMDAFGFEYLYDWDDFNLPTVVHRKTMLVKNDDCVSWVGELHEDLQETRQLDVYVVEGIQRLHLTTKERGIENAKRNVAIAESQVQANPNDPRNYWNLANSQLGVADYLNAEATFRKFLEDSSSEDEKYLARERLADIYRSLDRREDAIRQLQIAIGLKPQLPDAYFQLAHAYFSFGDMNKAEHYSIQGMLKRPQPSQMIVFNPRDYDYNPMMLLARVYYEKNRPDLMLPLLKGCLKIYPNDKHLQNLVKDGEEEKESLAKALEQVKKLQDITDLDVLKREIDALPDEIKSHPAICVIRNKHFVKTESSGRDLVIYCGNTTHQWNPELFKTKGFGGSEEAIVHLAREWAKLGWNVTVYNNCGHKVIEERVETGYMIAMDTKKKLPIYSSITYRPFWEWNYRDKQDVTILWRWPKPLDAEINSGKIFLDLHDVPNPGEFTEKRVAKLDKIFMKTEFHRSFLPNVPDEKIAVIPNGLDVYLDPSIKKDPYLVINTSSPDRSMDILPKLWKRVKVRVPQAKMKWYYGWDVYKASYASDSKMMNWLKETQAAIDEAGIESMGKIPQAEIGRVYQEATALAYPTEFAEIDCISVKKAQAAQCIPVATDFGALDESIEYGLTVHSPKDKTNWNKPYQFHFGLEDEKAQDEWVENMVRVLTGDYKQNWTGIEEFRNSFEWASIASRWNEVICG